MPCIYYLINHTLVMSTLSLCSCKDIAHALAWPWLCLLLTFPDLHSCISSFFPSLALCPSTLDLHSGSSKKPVFFLPFCSSLMLTLGEPIYSHSFKHHIYANDAHIYIFSPIFNQSKSSLITKLLFPAFSCLLDTFSRNILLSPQT